jgi:putative intracellular protease/amidase
MPCPGALIKVKVYNGDPLVKGKNVTGFSDAEESAVKLTNVVPFLLEDELKKMGGNYSKGPDWGQLRAKGRSPDNRSESGIFGRYCQITFKDD